MLDMPQWEQTLVLCLLLLFLEAVCVYYSSFFFFFRVIELQLNQKLKREGAKKAGSKATKILKAFLSSEEEFFCGICCQATYSGVVYIFLRKLASVRILEEMPDKRTVLLLLGD